MCKCIVTDIQYVLNIYTCAPDEGYLCFNFMTNSVEINSNRSSI